MTVHDWSRVDDGLFHAFHQLWIARLTEALNGGILPDEYYARPEQRVRRTAPDVLTFHAVRPAGPPTAPPAGAIAVATAPPRVRVRKQLVAPQVTRQRRIVIRRGEDELVAVIEVAAAANKDRRRHVRDFAGKVGAFLRAGIHVAILDLLPPTRHTPGGWYEAVAADFRLPPESDDEATQPADTPIALLSYEADMPDFWVNLDYIRPGDPLPELPLFLAPEYYVPLPLGPTYEQTFRGLGRIDRDRTAPP